MPQFSLDELVNTQAILEARIVLTAAELDVFSLLDERPVLLEAIAEALKARPRPLAMLLDALASMELLQKSEQGYFCPPEVASLLSAKSPESILPMARHLSRVWANASKLTSKVLGRDQVEALGAEEQMRAFIGAMHVRARQNADAIVAQVGADRHKRLIDIGGGSGSYTIAFLTANPQMAATLFDLPFVVELARERLGQAGLLDRVELVGGDFSTDELPAGHDLAFLSAVAHQNSPEQTVELYSKAFRALQPGGRLVIRDHIMSEDHTSPRSGAVFAINMLCGTDVGGTYSFAETRGALEQAGFRRVHALSTDAGMDCLIEAFRPN